LSRQYNQYCARCGLAFRQGQTRYIVTINVVADFDGVISPPSSPLELQRLWEEVEKKSEEELTNEVYQKLSFVLCKPCRDFFVVSPFGEDADQDGPAAGPMH